MKISMALGLCGASFAVLLTAKPAPGRRAPLPAGHKWRRAEQCERAATRQGNAKAILHLSLSVVVQARRPAAPASLLISPGIMVRYGLTTEQSASPEA
jgi:hypothetical protein